MCIRQLDGVPPSSANRVKCQQAIYPSQAGHRSLESGQLVYELFGDGQFGNELFDAERFGDVPFGTEQIGTERFGDERFGNERFRNEQEAI